MHTVLIGLEQTRKLIGRLREDGTEKGFMKKINPCEKTKSNIKCVILAIYCKKMHNTIAMLMDLC